MRGEGLGFKVKTLEFRAEVQSRLDDFGSAMVLVMVEQEGGASAFGLKALYWNCKITKNDVTQRLATIPSQCDDTIAARRPTGKAGTITTDTRRVQGSGFRVQGSGFGGSGFRVWGLGV